MAAAAAKAAVTTRAAAGLAAAAVRAAVIEQAPRRKNGRIVSTHLARLLTSGPSRARPRTPLALSVKRSITHERQTTARPPYRFRIEEGEQKVGGIIIPDTAKEKPQQGKVI